MGFSYFFDTSANQLHIQLTGKCEIYAIQTYTLRILPCEKVRHHFSLWKNHFLYHLSILCCPSLQSQRQLSDYFWVFTLELEFLVYSMQASNKWRRREGRASYSCTLYLQAHSTLLTCQATWERVLFTWDAQAELSRLILRMRATSGWSWRFPMILWTSKKRQTDFRN